MITVELHKKDIISMIRGTYPSYDQISNLQKLKLGSYIGGFTDSWRWNSISDLCWDWFSESELYDIYMSLNLETNPV